MALPNPGMDAVPFTPLTSEFLDNLIENIESLSSGTGFDTPSTNHGFLEIGRTTLTVAGDTITVLSIPAKRYLKIVCNVEATGGTVDSFFRFNNDTGNNYTAIYQTTINGAGTATAATSSIPVESGATDSGQQSSLEIDLIGNRSTEEKIFWYKNLSLDAAGAATMPSMITGFGKWANTTDQITRFDLLNTGGTGDFAIGSEIIVFGCD